jgi:hypothetical protein
MKGPTLIRVIAEARQNTQAHGDRGLEVHVVAPEVSLSQATNAPAESAAVPVRARHGRRARVGGYCVVQSSGAP